MKPASFGVTRMTGAPYIVDDTNVRNQFLVRLVNKRSVPMRFVVHLDGAPAGVDQIGFGTAVLIGPLEEVVQPLVVQQPRGAYVGPFHFELRVEDSAGAFQLKRAVDFLGPEARLLREDEGQKK